MIWIKKVRYLLICFLVMVLVSGASMRTIFNDSVKPSGQNSQSLQVNKVRQIVFWNAHLFGVSKQIAYQLMLSESEGNPRALHHNLDGTIDRGLFQLNSAWLNEFSWRYNQGKKIDPYDEWTSTSVALQYLAALIKATGSIRDALIAYNCGLARFERGAPQDSIDNANDILKKALDWQITVGDTF